jgi:hypothetical protein
MKLPKLKNPIYEITLPLSKQTIKYRGWTVKEEKILLIAKESTDPKEYVRAIIQVLNNCTLTSKVNFEALPILDIEYYFLELRKVSVSNIVELNIVDARTDEVTRVLFNLDDIKIKEFDNHQSKIILDEKEKIGVQMKYPNYNITLKLLELKQIKAKDIIGLLDSCIEFIFDSKTVYKLSDYTKEEIQEFFDSLDHKQLEKIIEFFSTIPRIQGIINYKDAKGEEKQFTLDNIRNFF